MNRPFSFCGSLAVLSHLVLLALAPSAQAAPITYTYTGTGSGTFNGTPFTDQTFTWFGQGDTTNFFLFSGVFPAVSLDTATFTVTGFPTAFPLDHYNLISNTSGGGFFLDDPGFDGNGFSSPTLSGWGADTAIGPVPVNVAFTGVIASDQGVIQLANTSEATFQAITGSVTAPEPGSLALLGMTSLPLIGMICCRTGRA